MPELPGANANQESHPTSYHVPWWYFAIIAALAIALVISLASLYLISVQQRKGSGQAHNVFEELYSLPVDLDDPAVKGNSLSYELIGVIDTIDQDEAAQQSTWVIKTANQRRYTVKVPWATVAFVNLGEKEIPKPNYRPSETYVKADAKVGDRLRIMMRTDLQKKIHSISQIQQLE